MNTKFQLYLKIQNAPDSTDLDIVNLFQDVAVGNGLLIKWKKHTDQRELLPSDVPPLKSYFFFRMSDFLMV
jgi:hypothetical protein